MFVCRSASDLDIDTLADFNCRLAWETENRALDPETVRRGVTRSLQLSPEVRYFVAEADSAIVGQLMLTREWSDWRDGWMVWLQSVYVCSDWRGRGVFRTLLNHAVAMVTAEDRVVNLRLYVEHHNDVAKNTYRTLGFSDAGYEVMEMPLNNRIQS